MTGSRRRDCDRQQRGQRECRPELASCCPVIIVPSHISLCFFIFKEPEFGLPSTGLPSKILPLQCLDLCPSPSRSSLRSPSKRIGCAILFQAHLGGVDFLKNTTVAKYKVLGSLWKKEINTLSLRKEAFGKMSVNNRVLLFALGHFKRPHRTCYYLGVRHARERDVRFSDNITWS